MLRPQCSIWKKWSDFRLNTQLKINAQKKMFSFNKMLRWKCSKLQKILFWKWLYRFCHLQKKTDIRRASKYIDIITINFFFYVARNYEFRKQIINHFFSIYTSSQFSLTFCDKAAARPIGIGICLVINLTGYTKYILLTHRKL